MLWATFKEVGKVTLQIFFIKFFFCIFISCSEYVYVVNTHFFRLTNLSFFALGNIFTRLGVAGAVPKTPLLLIH